MRSQILKFQKPVLAFFLALIFIFTQPALAQSIITGTVSSADDGMTLPGATVQIKGTSEGTITDIDGKYTLTASEGDVLVISYVGFLSQEVTIGTRTVVDVALEYDVVNMEEVVVVGYGSIRKSDVTGAVSSISSEDISALPFADPVQAMQGRVSGMQILNASGEPGAAPIIRLRGITTLNNNNPLFVVDGVIIDVTSQGQGSSLDFINPNDIESVEVLKDASATAIFGARGSNGVILITTKSGRSEDVEVNLNIEQGWESATQHIDLMNGREFATFLNEITPGFYNNLDVLPNTDWQEEIFKENAAISNYNVSFSGATEKSRFYTSIGYYYQEGILPKSDLQRITGKVNLEFDIKDRITLGVNLSAAHYDKENAPGVITTAYRAWPTNAPKDDEGNFIEVFGGGNPLAAIEYTNSDRQNLRTIGNLWGEVKIVDGLTFRSSIQSDADFFKSRSFTPQYFVAPLQQNETSDINKGYGNAFSWLWENTLSYTNQWGIHRVNSVVGYTAQERTSEFINGRTENLLRDDELFWYLNGGDLNPDWTTVNNSGGHSAITSLLFRVNYSLADRYLITATGRRDASSNFGELNRSGFFPSVALGWNIHEESFFAIPAIDQMKFRASWGRVGNEKIDFLKQYSTIQTGFNAVFNEQLVSGATFSSGGNPELKWEETEQLDIGLNLEMLDSRLIAEMDYYVKTTDGILVDLLPPGYTGLGSFQSVTFNAANVRNSGFEFNLIWRDRLGSDWDYSLGFNGSTINNEVLDLGEDVGADSVLVGGDLGNGQRLTRTIVGESIGFLYGYEIAGVFQTPEQVAELPSLFGQEVGDFIFRDRDGNGFINDADKINMGSSVPNFVYGFNGEVGWKGVRLSMFWQGQSGNKIYNGKATVRFSQLNYERSFLNRWTPDNPSNRHPRATSGGPNYLPSEYFVEDGSYLRLRTLTLSYDLPQKWMDKAKLGSTRLYVRGTNLVTFTKFSGYSPDLGSPQATDGIIDRGAYPVTRVYSIGMNLKF